MTSPHADAPGSGTEIPDWDALARPIPAWYPEARFGIFVHWGPYSVPGWAEPLGELGAIEEHAWYARNPYSEWYWNSLRIAGSPTAEHHRTTFGDVPYDAFLDAWHAERFDAGELMRLVAHSGAGYVIPTTKHHDGIALWAAPGSRWRNTVVRGPRRDLVGEMAAAARALGLRFGTYYSGGLDWGYGDNPPIRSHADLKTHRPTDGTYAAYAYRQVVDLVDRYRPDVLWNDIDWPDAGKVVGPHGLYGLFERFRSMVPDGVVNDRWGVPFHDVRTSEYQFGLDAEAAPAWEHTRGIGYSFGYNRNEGPDVSLSVADAVRLLVDTVSRGGNLLLNIGPRADGSLPETQQHVLEGLGEWMEAGRSAIRGAGPVIHHEAYASDDPWIRWTLTHDAVFAIVDPGLRLIETRMIPAEVDLPVVAGNGITADQAGMWIGPRAVAPEVPAVIRLPRR